MMIAPQLLNTLFLDNYTRIKEATANITHGESIQTPSIGGNCIHWIVGHLVVARCNFLMFLNIPSIWDWPICKLFIPGSGPTVESADQLRFSRILADLDRTQDQLQAALNRTESSDLELAKKDKTVAEHLAEYALHEAYHAGQLDLLRQAVEGS
jgi:hypothetical protein